MKRLSPGFKSTSSRLVHTQKSSVVKRLIQCHLQQMNTYGGSRERERLRYRLSWPRMGERERERLRGLRPRSSG